MRRYLFCNVSSLLNFKAADGTRAENLTHRDKAGGVGEA